MIPSETLFRNPHATESSYEDINYVEVVSWIQYNKDIITARNDMKFSKPSFDPFTVTLKHAMNDANMDVIKFFMYHYKFNRGNFIIILNSTSIVRLESIFSDIVKLLLHPHIRSCGPFHNNSGFAHLFKKYPKLYGEYFFNLTKEEKRRAISTSEMLRSVCY